MTALEMRALYYIALSVFLSGRGSEPDTEDVKATENCLNQNFTIIAQKIAELDERLSLIENAL